MGAPEIAISLTPDELTLLDRAWLRAADYVIGNTHNTFVGSKLRDAVRRSERAERATRRKRELVEQIALLQQELLDLGG